MDYNLFARSVHEYYIKTQYIYRLIMKAVNPFKNPYIYPSIYFKILLYKYKSNELKHISLCKRILQVARKSICKEAARMAYGCERG